MTNSKSIPTNQKETLAYIDDSAVLLDEQRLKGLQEEQNTQLIKDEIWQREKKRLEAKHGNSHPVVRQAENRMVYNKQVFTGLEKEIDRASVKTAPFPNTAWRVHGRVFDYKGNPVKSVTVFLADPNKKWMEITGNSCTNESGYYSLTVDEKQLTGFDQKQPLHLAVSDKNKKILYFATTPIFIAKGLINQQDIYLKEDDCVLPPVNDHRETKLPPDAWVVRGKVSDENDKGLQGLTVSFYDKDLFFDDVLGTTLTNENGNFEIIYRADAFELFFEKKPDVYLKVLDGKGKKLYTSQNKVRPGAGRVEEFIIKIDAGKKQ
jgi:hypothetical protein